jgi:8-oxo-dGTP diphosphatase
VRRYGPPVRPDRAYADRPGVYAVIRDGPDVLLTHQDEPRPEFQLPGGGLDPGEAPLTALHRECLEETGWRIVVVRRLGAFQRYTYMPEYDLWARKVCAVYLARPTLRRGPPAEAGHLAVWAPLAEAARLVAAEGDRAFLAALAR